MVTSNLVPITRHRTYNFLPDITNMIFVTFPAILVMNGSLVMKETKNWSFMLCCPIVRQVPCSVSLYATVCVHTVFKISLTRFVTFDHENI